MPHVGCDLIYLKLGYSRSLFFHLRIYSLPILPQLCVCTAPPIARRCKSMKSQRLFLLSSRTCSCSTRCRSPRLDRGRPECRLWRFEKKKKKEPRHRTTGTSYLRCYWCCSTRGLALTQRGGGDYPCQKGKGKAEAYTLSSECLLTLLSINRVLLFCLFFYARFRPFFSRPIARVLRLHEGRRTITRRRRGGSPCIRCVALFEMRPAFPSKHGDLLSRCASRRIAGLPQNLKRNKGKCRFSVLSPANILVA